MCKTIHPLVFCVKLLLLILVIANPSKAFSQVEGADMSSPIIMDNGGTQGNIYEFPQGHYTYEHGGDNDFTGNYGDDYGNDSPDVFYRFTVLGNTQLEISTCESSFDTYIYLLDANGNEIGSNDDNGPLCWGTSSSIITSIEAGTYYIVVESGISDYHTWGSYYLTVDLTVSPPIPSEGINTANAIIIGNYTEAGTYNYTDSRSNAAEYGYGNDMGQASDDIYYTFTVSNTASVTASLCGSDFDTYLYLLNSSGAVLQSNNDNGPLCSGTRSSLQATDLPAGTYYIVAEGNGSSYGTISLSVNTVLQSQLNTVLPTNTQNFIYTRTILKDNVYTATDLQNLTDNNVRSAIQYFDGLGRPLQNVSVQAAPDGKDIVTPIVYDAFGRQDKSYLPYAASGTSGAYRASALSEQTSFYTTPPTVSIPAIPNPYSQTVFEASPLNRPLEAGAPGASWAIGNGHTVKTGYEINTTNEVRLWNITPPSGGGGGGLGATSSGYYAGGQLYKNVSEDEHQNKVIEYKDKEGQVVCKKVQDGGTEQSPTFMVTQYIYDDLGNLAYVIPPALESITSFTEADTNFENYIYAYHYDERRRLIEKKIPGKGWEYTVYNAADRPVFTSDAEQRNREMWSFIKYDALGRVIMTGEATNASNRATLQAAVNSTLKPTGATELYETYNGSTGSSNMGYTNITLPNTNFKILTVNYYDDYNIFTIVNPLPTTTHFHVADGTANESQRTKSLPTVNAVNILGTTTYLYTATYYTDDKARVSKIVKQHQFNGVDITANTYNFVGEVTATTRQHYKDGSLALTVNNSYQYDHAGRKTQTTETINSQSPVITNYTYNAVGQLETKSAGGQTTNYKYNARGWIKEQSSGLFTQQLKYDDASGSYAQYNGNIGQQLWTTNGQSHSYNYSYDKANRLLSGVSDENYNESGIQYDKMGNIQTLTRQHAGLTVGVGTLNYNYGTSGNRLQSVSGGYTKSYSYNNNGSMTGDGTLNIQYNELNLPKQVTGTPVGTVSYTYDAVGSKLTKQTVNETKQYIDGIEYIGTAIDLLHTEAGVARNNGGAYTYEFFLADHLGNTRIVHNSSGTVLQQQDYMPFGVSIGRWGSDNRYLYNGKEQQQELGGTQGGQYDYGARFYDPVIGRWHVVDPLSEIYKRHSVYTYALNNPILLTDPDGMSVDTSIVNTVLETVFVFAVRTTPWWRAISIPAMGPIRPPNPVTFFIAALLLPSNWDQKPYIEKPISQKMQDESLRRYIEGLDEKEKKEQEGEEKERSENEIEKAKEAGDSKNSKTNNQDSDNRIAEEIIQKERKGSINREFPDQYRKKTLKEIERSAKTDKEAKKALKLLRDGRFKK